MKRFPILAVALLVYGGMQVAYALGQTAGERKGDRCYNGKFWTTCVAPPLPELAERPSGFVTKTWQLGHLANAGSTPEGGVDGYSQLRVDVIETEGACIYVSRSWIANDHSLAVLPKTQLRPGVGCQ